MPEKRVHHQQQRSRYSCPERVNAPAHEKQQKGRQHRGQKAASDKRSFRTVEQMIEQACFGHEQRVTGGLRLVQTRIKVFQRQREINGVEGKQVAGSQGQARDRNQCAQKQKHNQEPASGPYLSSGAGGCGFRRTCGNGIPGCGHGSEGPSETCLSGC